MLLWLYYYYHHILAVQIRLIYSLDVIIKVLILSDLLHVGVTK